MGCVGQSRLVKKEALIVMGKGGGGDLQFNVEKRGGDGWSSDGAMNIRRVESSHS